MTTLNAQQILHIIVSECKNGCTSPSNTFEYFSKFYKDRVDPSVVTALANSLNFDEVRNNESLLFEATK